MLSAIILHHAQQPHHHGRIKNADAVGQVGRPGEGPYMTVSLSLDKNCIREAYFETYGCPTAIACGSWLTQWVAGRTVETATLLEPDDLARVLGGLSLGKEHCAQLAVGALRAALSNVPDSFYADSQAGPRLGD